MTIPLNIQQMMANGRYQAYTYAYPHKTAYRPLTPPQPLAPLWAQENQDNLFLYLHIPFCEMRCGFCNLFTTANPQTDTVTRYLHTLRHQAQQLRHILPHGRIAQVAIGGGTPTYLTPAELDTLFTIIVDIWNVDPTHTPIAIEASPATATPDRLARLRDFRISRLSLGLESAIPAELRALGRPERLAAMTAAWPHLHHADFPSLNIDLIYGIPGQTPTSWRQSLQLLVDHQVDEIYLYPLYVRPLTGLGRQGTIADNRFQLYQIGRDFLLDNGYHQQTMRHFQRHPTTNATTTYHCQEDGMIGLGCGARSYTRTLHYATDYAVSRPNVRAILHDWLNRPTTSWTQADYGFHLNQDEQKRRYLLKSLLHHTGLHTTHYQAYFGTHPLTDFPQLNDLVTTDLATATPTHYTLTPTGLAWSDAIGPWLYSPTINHLSQTFTLT
ncbi:MAG TPA: STM4012 family radical SAM protein [Anaerolineae bacterium]|nr:STM4012 family radical SAM protein [Anaerolineae bacterium]